MNLLVTRPAEDAEKTCAAIEAMGHVAVSAPLFRVVILPHATDAAFDALLATSAHAPRLLANSIRMQTAALPFFAVGDATAYAARVAGFRDVRSAQGDAAALAALVHSVMPKGARLLYLAGNPRRDTAVQALEGTFTLETLEIYETHAVEKLPDAAIAGLKAEDLDAVLHFSPRATQVFLALADKAGLIRHSDRLMHICISDAARDRRLIRYKVAAEPTLQGMLEALKTS